jgi:ribose 5-phosphate isomerase B
MKKIAIGADHTGFDKKALIINFLQERGYELKDFGCYSTESFDYPDAAHPVALAVESGECEWGVLLCGSANGVAITANKHQCIRAGLAWLPEIAALIKMHNNANIICIPARYTDNDSVIAIMEAYLGAEFEGGRHEKRIEKIAI